jgi:SAM-dependent methyltransferase
MRAVDRHIEELGPAGLTAAEISGDSHAGKPWKRFESLNYPEFDLCAPLEGRGTYDVVICEQVIEHVVDPWAAAGNLRGLCAPGGHVIVSTPFLIRIHELPMYGMRDYWRFTPRGLQTLLERAGLVVDSVGSWGNRRCVAGNLDHWPAYRRWLPLRNEPNLPVQVWAFARNPA